MQQEPSFKNYTIPRSEYNPLPRRLAYWEWGDAAKPVVFCVHGMTRNGRDFDFLARRLIENYRVICPDVAGRGKSDWLKDKTAYHNFTYAGDILQMIKYLSLEEIKWVGTSMGGLIGMIAAATKPGLIKKMVINDIGPFIPKEALRRIAEYTGKNTSFFSWESAKKSFKEIYAPWGIKDDKDIEHMMKYSLGKNPAGYVLLSDPGIGANFRDENGKLKELPDMDIWEIWNKITSPVLVLRGEKSDLFPKEVALKMTECGPKARLVEIPGVGHAPSLMEEGQVKIIEDFLKS